MKNKIKYAVYALFNFASALTTRKRAFCNIAEGTHAGSITMTAGENIDMQNLLVSAGENEGEIIVAQTTSKPLGVCIDEGIKGEKLAVVWVAQPTQLSFAVHRVISLKAILCTLHQMVKLVRLHQMDATKLVSHFALQRQVESLKSTHKALAKVHGNSIRAGYINGKALHQLKNSRVLVSTKTML